MIRQNDATDAQFESDVASQNSVLLVSPHFPPSTLAGVHRVRHLAKHLPAHGWRPIVIRVDERHYTETADPGISTLVPASVVQVRTDAIPARMGRLFGIRDIGIRAYRQLATGIKAAVAEYNPKAVLITGSPYYPMLLSGWIRRRLNIPVVLDFQDPWVCAEGATRPYFSKGRLAHRLSVALEPQAVKASSWITSVSAIQNKEMATRYPWLNNMNMSAIPIGGDPQDFEITKTDTHRAGTVSLDRSRVNLCYVGTFLPRATPVVRAVFQALAILKRERPQLAQRLRLVFVGTSNQPEGNAAAFSSHTVLPIAAEEGVADLVQEHTARVPFADALRLNATADALMLLGSDEPHYTASKIYPALMSGRPYVSVFHSLSSSHEILSRCGGGVAIGFCNQIELGGLAPTIAAAIERLAGDPSAFGTVDPSFYAPYTAHAVAGQFAQVFTRVST